MRKGTVKTKSGSMLMVMMLVLLFSAGAVKIEDRSSDAQLKTGAGLIVIDVLKATGPLERPPVMFFHSRHTEALAKINRDCSVCHGADEKGRLSPKFKRTADTDRQTVTDIYHVNCVACHRELADTQESGPLTCGGCHQEDPAAASTWTALTFDKSLHYRHVKANEEKCESCHHEFDKKTQQLVYVKGKEGACVYCHQENPADEKTLALKQATHFQCIGCHRDRMANNQLAGPDSCVGCHDADYQAGIKVLDTVPRLERGQPDVVLIHPDEKTIQQTTPGEARPSTMDPVPFDHLGHETANASCKVCHHASLESCTRCHTTPGKKEGGMVKLAQAMHSTTDNASCIGCHQEMQQAPQCAGCHAFMGKRDKAENESCAACHAAPLSALADPADTKATRKIASNLIQERNTAPRTYSADQIPETVTIAHLSDQFEPASFPHGKIVSTLVEKTRDSRLAGYFHTEKGTLCQGCHHNSPAAEKPPLCSSCHGQPVEGGEAFKPGLSGAYHQQCIGCHTVMGIEKPAARDCNACHAEKNNG